MGRPWSTQEAERLRELAAQGMTLSEAATHFPGRSALSVAHKASEMGLRFRPFSPLALHPYRESNRLDGYSAMSIVGFRTLEQGLAVMARHGRDGHVVWGRVRVPYVDAVSNLLESIHRSARLARQGGGRVA